MIKKKKIALPCIFSAKCFKKRQTESLLNNHLWNRINNMSFYSDFTKKLKAHSGLNWLEESNMFPDIFVREIRNNAS